MKIRHPALLQAAGFAIAWMVRVWVGTLRYRRTMVDAGVDPLLPGQKRRFLYAFWHETLLIPALRYAQTPTTVLISQHADGEMIAHACRHLGVRTVRGSTTRGGVEAMRQILKLKGRRHIVVTPDGPKGPRRVVQPGMLFLAARTGLPIVPVGFGFRTAWRLRSWDRFALPCPFSPVVGVIGAPLHVPADLNRSSLEHWRQKAQEAMDRVTAEAEEWANRESW